MQELKDLLTRAAKGESNVYFPEMNLYDFYNRYAPSSDNNNPKSYAEFVAKKIGVSPNVKIKTLI